MRKARLALVLPLPCYPPSIVLPYCPCPSRYACCHAYGYTFAALDLLRNDKAGVGVRLAAEAVTFRNQAEKLGGVYDQCCAAAGGAAAGKKLKAAQSQLASGRRPFQDDLDKEVCVMQMRRQEAA